MNERKAIKFKTNHKITSDVLQMHQISLEIQNKGYKHSKHLVGQ